MLIPFPTRQVHLDFHTSELIPGVGRAFDAAQFQKALKLGNVQSITLFAKCHHSWSYYPTKVGRRHPTLKGDLLGRQIKACHDIGVRAPIYITVGWSANDAETHPEWLARGKDGAPIYCHYDPNAKPEDPKPAVSWKFLCPNGGYRDLIVAQTQEVCDKYPVDGMFYDICTTFNCFCDACRAGMKEEGVDPEDGPALWAYTRRKWANLMKACRSVIFERHPNATVFFNGLAHADTPPELLDLQTHFELEDLPTTWGGYDKFPLRAKYFASHHNKPILAMSGKFHTTWGEFGGFKHPDAIRYEAASMVANGAACSFGDQVHPNGEMDLETYRNIGHGYKYVKQIAPYGIGGKPYSTLGVWLSGKTPHDQGVANMLMEGHLDFEVVLKEGDLGKYDTLILPGAPTLTEAQADKLQTFVDEGGALLVLAESALLKDTTTLALDIGGKYAGPAAFKQDYLQVRKPLAKGLVESPFLNYEAALRVIPKGGDVLADIREPYFDRTYAHYCSHQNTPYTDKPARHAGVLQNGRVIFFAHALGKLYYDHGARLHRDLFLNAVRRLHKRPVIEAGLPSAGRVSVLHQADQRRYCVHLLYGPPLQRGRCLVIEDLPTLHDIPLTLRVPEKIKRVRLPLANKTLSAKTKGNAKTLVLPELQCHEVVTFEY